MVVTRSIDEIRSQIALARSTHHRISLVPTMGALHEGHLSLITLAKKDSDFCVMSIFVNRIQFNDKSDFDKYPRDYEKDILLAKSAGCDCVFLPDDSVMYRNHHTYIIPEYLDEYLCGATRPGHFKGVCTVVAKLFNIVQPDIAVFGQKDIQQAAIISKMVEDLNIPVKMVVAPIIREASGLAKSSRNIHLSQNEHERALSIIEGLKRAESMIKQGTRDAQIITDAVRSILEKKSPDAVDYVSLVDFDTLHPVNSLLEKSILAIAAFFGRTRLIDNMIINISEDSIECRY